MKHSITPIELSKIGQITPRTVLKIIVNHRKNHKIENSITLDLE
jgi:hypothetical protein